MGTSRPDIPYRSEPMCWRMSSAVVDGNEAAGGGCGSSSILTTASASPVEVTWAVTLSPFLRGAFILVSSVTLSRVSKPVGS